MLTDNSPYIMQQESKWEIAKLQSVCNGDKISPVCSVLTLLQLCQPLRDQHLLPIIT